MCWFDPYSEAKGIVGGCHYNVYIIHAIDIQDRGYEALHNMKGAATVFVEIEHE